MSILNIKQTLFSANEAQTSSGALSISTTMTVQISNANFLGNNVGDMNDNMTLTGGQGGALFIFQSKNVYLYNIEFYGNIASGLGGALYLKVFNFKF